MNALIARESARGGAFAGVRAGLPAPIVDTCYLALVVFGVSRLIDLRPFLPWLSAVGAVLLAYLAWATVRPPRTSGPVLAGPLAVWAVTLTNPFQYAWWASAGAVSMIQTRAWGILGFLAAIFGWVFVFSFAVARGAQQWGWFLPLLEILSADLLLVYAVKLGWTAATGMGL